MRIYKRLYIYENDKPGGFVLIILKFTYQSAKLSYSNNHISRNSGFLSLKNIKNATKQHYILFLCTKLRREVSKPLTSEILK